MTALPWALNAKNCLPMWCGFSSYQLVYGKNPNLPLVMTDNSPALEGSTVSSAYFHKTLIHYVLLLMSTYKQNSLTEFEKIYDIKFEHFQLIIIMAVKFI